MNQSEGTAPQADDGTVERQGRPLLERLRAAGEDYTVEWGSGELYDEAADALEKANKFGADAHDSATQWMQRAQAVKHLPTDGAMTPARWQAFHALEAALLYGLSEAKAAGVAQGLIVALLHGHAYQQTAAMVDAA